MYIMLSAMFDTNAMSGQDKGVSPVIGVILMVAITVILAAVIGTFVLDLAGSVEQNAQASVTFDDSSNTLRIISMQNADSVDYKVADGSFKDLGSNVGDSVSVTASSGDTITVRATLDGNSSVIQTFEVQS